MSNFGSMNRGLTSIYKTNLKLSLSYFCYYLISSQYPPLFYKVLMYFIQFLFFFWLRKSNARHQEGISYYLKKKNNNPVKYHKCNLGRIMHTHTLSLLMKVKRLFPKYPRLKNFKKWSNRKIVVTTR